MSPAKEAAGERRQVVPQDDDVTRGYPDRDDVDCDVIDARRRHASTSLDTSLTTEVMDDDDVDDDNEDQDTDGKKRKKTRTVFSRHQVITAPVLPSCSK